MPRELVYLFENRFLYMQCLVKQEDYTSSLGKLLDVLHVLNKEDPNFQNDIQQLAQNSKVVLVEKQYSRPKAEFIINADEIHEDTLNRFDEGIKKLPSDANKRDTTPRIKLIA